MSVNKKIMNLLPAATLFFSALPAHATTFIDPDAELSWLGRGVQSQSGLFKGACVSGTAQDSHSKTLGLSYQDSKTARQSLREMSGSVSANINLGLFGGGVSVQMHTRLEDNENTASLVFHLRYNGKDVILHDRSLTALGQSLVGSSPSVIEESCGDQYIDHMQLGNDLYFVSQMVFASKEDYEKFVTKIKVRVLFFTATATITDTFYEYAASGRYNIKALSSNPLPQTIIDELGYDGEINCYPNQSAGMAPCVNAGNNIMNYLFDPNGYKSWLADDSHLGITYFNASSYEKTGHADFAGIVAVDNSALATLHEQLLDELTVQYNQRNIIKPYAEALSLQQQIYDPLLLKVDANIAALESAMASCKANPEFSSCQAAINNAIGQLNTIEL